MNKFNANLLKFGKSKTRMLKFALLLMLFPVTLAALKAQTPPTGLNMTKNWTSTSDTGDEGYVTLEAFVTGSSVTVETHAPTDIALVLDVSGSMAWGMSRISYNSLNTTKGAIEGYYVRRRTSSSSTYYPMRYHNGEWQEYSRNSWRPLQSHDYLYISRMGALKDAVSAFVDIIAEDAVQHNVDHRISVVKFATNSYYGGESSVLEGNHFNGSNYNYTEVLLNRRDAKNDAATIKVQVNALVASGATAADYGLRKVRYLFQQIPASQTDRAKVVVMFTDGSPTHSNGFQTSVANAAITNAKEYKDAGAKVFTVGTFGPDPGNNVLNYMNYVSSNYPNAISMNNPGTIADPANFFFTADTPEQLSNVFESIAHSSSNVPVQMNEQTIVQDQIGTNFALPQGTLASNISVYVPKCTGVNTSTTPYEYTFENPLDGDTLNGGNQLFNAVTIENDLIKITGFNFSSMWCGLQMPAGTVHGRKLVIKIPLKIEEGVWGDGLPTNGPLSLIFPNGDLLNPIGSFPIPQANVLGDVWTEIVTEQPANFDPQNIDSPEDLAWFISVVNGRANYDANNTLTPNPATNGKLTADIDMSAHNWIPIGSSGIAYTGTFDGNGHVITGLKNNASKFYKHNQTVLVLPGMFGRVGGGGVVKNVFVLDCDMNVKRTDSLTQSPVCYGVIVDTLCAGATIFNCEAAGSLSMDRNSRQLVLLGGLVGWNDGTIHSCMAMVHLKGIMLGGLVGVNAGSLRNSFANPLFELREMLSTENGFGGIACTNAGGTATIDNCYVRLGRSHVLGGKSYFQMAYVNNGTIGNCFAPEDDSMLMCGQGSGTCNVVRYPVVTAPYLYDYDANTQNAMLAALNAHRGTGSEWKRTTAGRYSDGAGDINGDYPILKYGEFTCAASTDGIAIDYSRSLSDMLKRHNEGNLNENTNLPGPGSGYVYPGQGPQNTHDYHVNAHPAVKGGTINLYAHADNSSGSVQNTEGDLVVYIDENVSLLQGAASTIEAYTGQTLTKPGEYWHTVSSSICSSGIGFNYGTTSQVPYNWESNPCNTTLGIDDDHALFPHDAPVDKIDLFSFYEPQYHWINLKRNSLSHWHMDAPTENIPYTNETTLTPGKGYLAAIDRELLLQNRGTLNNGDISIAVSNTSSNAWTGLQGYNLLGNPYQSYLDFDAFVGGNGALWTGGAKYRNTYSVYDPTTDAYVQYMSNSSAGSFAASRYISMHQGFFIVMDGSATSATFSNAMRTNTAGNGFRDSKPNYPLVNLIVTDAKGLSDVAVLEMGREENTGARKMLLSTGAGSLYLRHEDGDYAILFRDEVKDYQPLYFEAAEDGVYTLRWNTANAAFSKLTLVDNIAGVSTDMLSGDSYVFTAKEGDYKSRFKIYVGSDAENPEVAPESPFAFMHNGQLVVNGGGRFDVVDTLGRILYSTELTGSQNSVSMPSNLKGVCILHLTDGETSKTQKVIL